VNEQTLEIYTFKHFRSGCKGYNLIHADHQMGNIFYLVEVQIRVKTKVYDLTPSLRDILLLESGFEPGLESGLEPGLESGLDQKNAKIRGIAITQWFCFIRHVTQAS
jgi:hypothetical protein